MVIVMIRCKDFTLILLHCQNDHLLYKAPVHKVAVVLIMVLAVVSFERG